MTMKALILAAGLGTRLRPLTLQHAKPSLPVLGVPSFWFAAEHLRETLNPSAFAMNVGHAAASLDSASKDKELSALTGIRFHISDESSQILGSSGALWRLKDWVGADLLAVANGDSISYPDWQNMLKLHKSSGALITMHVRKFSNASEPYTHIDVAENGRVERFGTKATQGTMFSGCYIISPEAIKRLPSGVSELRPLLLEPLAVEKKLFAYVENCPWIDTGTVGAYAASQFDLLNEMPQAKKLVEIKMREPVPGCWVPRSWPKDIGLKLQGPVVLHGDLESWTKVSKHYGPRFVGIKAATTPLRETADRLVFGEFTQSI